jgi:broad specificity phosphatase PhoE
MESVYFMCPGPTFHTIEKMNSMGLRFNTVVTSTTRRCLETASDVAHGVPCLAKPIVTDLLLPQGPGRVREQCSVLSRDFPMIDFTDYFEDALWLDCEESDANLVERVETLMRIVNKMEGSVLVVAPESVLRTYSGISLSPAGFFKQYENEDLGNWRSFMSGSTAFHTSFE